MNVSSSEISALPGYKSHAYISEKVGRYKTANSYLPTKCLKRSPSYSRDNTKPKHKSLFKSRDIQKLNRYFMERHNADGVWKKCGEVG